MIIDSSKKAFALLPPIQNTNQEQFSAMYLDLGLKLICSKVLFLGSKDSCEVRFSKIIQNYYLANANSIIIAHNHPSKNCLPSDNDVYFTKQLKTICETLEIKLIDHIVYTTDSYFSFYDENLLLVSKII